MAPVALSEERARRWRHDRPQVRTAAQVARFIEDVGFALVFPAKSGLPLPSLWTVARDRGPDAEPFANGWGPDMEQVWRWKDELPVKGVAWAGKFLRGQQSLLAPELIALLYGTWNTELGSDARRILELVTDNGPVAAGELRQIAGRAVYDRGVKELGRRLLVTHLGTERAAGGWPSVVIQRTDAVFEVSPPKSEVDRHRRQRAAAARILDTMIELRPVELARLAGWSSAEAKAALDQ